MEQSDRIDRARNEILKRMDRNERNYRLAFYGAVCLEALFLAAFLIFSDFSNRIHFLIFLSTVTVYSIIILGLFALGAHVDRCTLRLLKAFEVLSE